MNKERRLFFLNLLFPTLFVALLWLVQFAQSQLDFNFQAFGIYPRSIHGIPGIFAAPLIHGGYEHLLSNSLPLIVLGTMMFYFYKDIAFKIFFWVYLMTGLWVWAGARGGAAYHIGASGLVYGFVSFLFFGGIFRKDPRLLQISLLVLLFYNGLVWGVFPLVENISWESHLLGSVAGIFCAWFFRKEGPERQQYSWETEPDDDEEEDSPSDGPEHLHQDPKPPSMHVNYVFLPDVKKDKGAGQP
ncbi:MAG TPA: rhomboid family intramembrane serine protease [Bacteroidia bacterium]|jgi:membrane associated rhomboid family serine protease|nr:rhomboid family intramembrane serine protease [Bacteroidia bacterium]